MMLSMTFFDFLCNLTVLIIILFTALSYATGLFYLAELAEEYPTITKRIVRYLVLAIVTLHLLAFISALPKLPLILGLLLHLSYLALLTTFPILPLTSPIFYLSLLLLAATQLAWYSQMPTMPTSPYTSYPSYSYNNVRTYSSAQLLAFYLLFVWLVPLVLFVAGSVTGQSLPMDGERVRGQEEEESGGRWSFAGIGRWCKREKAGGGGSGREKKDDDRPAVQSHTSHRYEPNPAFYGNTAASPASSLASATYSAYQPAHHNNGADAQSWYGQQQQQQQQPNVYGSSSSEGEWMGQRLTSAPHASVRQRSHIS